jgi:hypothetical protein
MTHDTSNCSVRADWISDQRGWTDIRVARKGQNPIEHRDSVGWRLHIVDYVGSNALAAVKGDSNIG